MSRWSMIIAVALSFSCLWTASAAGAQMTAPPQPITIGETITLHSKVLNEDRRVMVHLPPDYSFASHRYPVIYILDGELLFAHLSDMADYLAARGQMPASIVVGVVNTDRNRDLLTTARDTRAFLTLYRSKKDPLSKFEALVALSLS